MVTEADAQEAIALLEDFITAAVPLAPGPSAVLDFAYVAS